MADEKAQARKLKCTIAEGRFVEPCDSLYESSEGRVPTGKARGIYWWDYTNLKTHKPSRTFFGAKTSDCPKGVAFNFCPFCGVQIDAPFTKKTKEDSTND